MSERAIFTNITRSDKLKYDLQRAFIELSDILEDHAGPLATSCLIGSKWKQVNDIDEFTKDGIKILTHLIVSEDVTARFVARIARFVGFAVDKRCHDGTTTAMLLFSLLAVLALEKTDLSTSDPDRYRQWVNLNKVMEKCLCYLDEIKITESDIIDLANSFNITVTEDQVRAAIGYHMAMISSKGDHDLSYKISEVIRTSPKSIYGMFKNIPMLLETEDRFTIKKQDFDISFDANPGHSQYWNYKSDTQFLAEDAVIFYTGNDIVKGSLESIFLRSFISTDPNERANLSEFGVDKGWEEFHENKRNLVIFSHMLQDSELFTDIIDFNREHPHCKIVHFNVQSPERMRTSLTNTVLYMSGARRFDDVSHKDALSSFIGITKRNIKVHAIGHTVQVSGLYEKTGEVFHPYYNDPSMFEPYTKYRNEMEELIEFATKNITNNALNSEEVTYLTNLYRCYTCQDIHDIEIGGLAHEQAANRTVYEDAMGSALAAVTDGIVLGGYGKIAKFLKLDTDGLEIEHYTEVKNSVIHYITWLIGATTRCNDSEVSNLIMSQSDMKWSYIVANKEKFYSGEDHVSVEIFDKSTFESFINRTNGDPILIQSWSGYNEQFKRFKDILPKLANTSNISDMRISEEDLSRVR